MPPKQDLVLVYMPSLRAALLALEDKKGSPLTQDEVRKIRDKMVCIAVTPDAAAKMEKSRGRDIDPENCWFEFQKLRRDLGRKPDLDPGARVRSFQRGDPEMEIAMQEAGRTLDRFEDLSTRLAGPEVISMIKTLIVEDETRTYLWLDRARKSGTSYAGRVFELPASVRKLRLGEESRSIPPRLRIGW